PEGVATFEFPHLLCLINGNQFDTIYHEHYSYLSLTSVETIFGRNGLAIYDVEELYTHGGSLRVYAQRSDTGRRSTTRRVEEILLRERVEGLTTRSRYNEFQQCAENIKNELLEFLLKSKREGKRVGAYGAAAKGNTLLN